MDIKKGCKHIAYSLILAATRLLREDRSLGVDESLGCQSVNDFLSVHDLRTTLVVHLCVQGYGKTLFALRLHGGFESLDRHVEFDVGSLHKFVTLARLREHGLVFAPENQREPDCPP